MVAPAANTFSFEDFATKFLSYRSLQTDINTSSKLTTVIVNSVSYNLYTIGKKSAEEFKQTKFEAADEENVKAFLNKQLSDISSELKALEENKQKEAITNLFASIAVDYAINKNRQTKDIVLALSKDLGDWARHYSTVRLTLGTFFVSAGFVILSLWKEQRSYDVAIWTFGLVVFGAVLFGIFTGLTYRRMNQQREKLSELAKRVPPVPSWVPWVDAIGLPLIVLFVYLVIIRLWCGASYFPPWPPNNCAANSTMTTIIDPEKNTGGKEDDTKNGKAVGDGRNTGAK